MLYVLKTSALGLVTLFAHIAGTVGLFSHEVKLSCFWSLGFIYYGIELNLAAKISNQSSKVKVNHTESTRVFNTNFREL